MGDHGSSTTNPLFSESLWEDWNWIDSTGLALVSSVESSSYHQHSASMLQKSEVLLSPRPFIASKKGFADGNVSIITNPETLESVPMLFSSGLELPSLHLFSPPTTDGIFSLPFPGLLTSTGGSSCSNIASFLSIEDDTEDGEEKRVSSVSPEDTGGSRARQESTESSSLASDETLGPISEEPPSPVAVQDLSIVPTDLEESLAQVSLFNGKIIKKDPQFSCPVSIAFHKTFS